MPVNRYETASTPLFNKAELPKVESQDGEVTVMGTTYWGEIVSRQRERVNEQGEDWGPLQAGLFDSSSGMVNDLLDSLEEVSTA